MHEEDPIALMLEAMDALEDAGDRVAEDNERSDAEAKKQVDTINKTEAEEAWLRAEQNALKKLRMTPEKKPKRQQK